MPGVAYTDAEARQELLDTLAAATDEIAFALACLGAAYEQLDQYSADRLEEQLFRPIQKAYGAAKRTHAAFAARHGLPGRTFEPPSAGLPSTGARGFIDNAVDAAGDRRRSARRPPRLTVADRGRRRGAARGAIRGARAARWAAAAGTRAGTGAGTLSTGVARLTAPGDRGRSVRRAASATSVPGPVALSAIGDVPVELAARLIGDLSVSASGDTSGIDIDLVLPFACE